MIFLFMLDALLVFAKHASWSNEDTGFKQSHYPHVKLTEFYSKPKYNAEPTYNALGMTPFHLSTHILYRETSRVPNGSLKS